MLCLVFCMLGGREGCHNKNVVMLCLVFCILGGREGKGDQPFLYLKAGLLLRLVATPMIGLLLVVAFAVDVPSGWWCPGGHTFP